MAVKELKDIQRICDSMIDAQKDSKKGWDAIDDAIELRWSLPQGLSEKEFMRAVVSTAAADAHDTSAKVLSSEEPHPKVYPMSEHPDNKNRANEMERVLQWEYWQADKRTEGRLTRKIADSALRYAAVCVQVVHLPTQFKSAELAGPAAKRRTDAAKRTGSFAVHVRNPKNVYWRYSDLGLEAVLLVQEMTVKAVVDYWGELAKDLFKAHEKDAESTIVHLYDYTDWEQRTIWVAPQGSSATERQEGGKVGTVRLNATGRSETDTGKTSAEFELMNEVHNLPFLPWVCRSYSKPLLEKVVKSGALNTMNIVGSLFTSEAIAYSAAPRNKRMGPNPDAIEIDYGEPGNDVKVPPGHDIEPYPTPPIDRALAEIYDRTKSQIDSMTNVQVLGNLNFPAGTAFATVNAVLQTALSSLQPYKELIQVSIADIFEQMLLWVDYSGAPLYAFGRSKSDYGRQYSIVKGSFDPAAIYIDVDLNAQAPTDYIQRLNAGSMMYQMGASTETVFESINISDPQSEMQRRAQEDLDKLEIQLLMQRRQAMVGAELQAQIQALQQEQMAQQQQSQMPQGNPMGQTPPAFDATQGQGWNPAQGGRIPGQAAPPLTREQVGGITRGGEPVAEV